MSAQPIAPLAESIRPMPGINQIALSSNPSGWIQLGTLCEDVENAKEVARAILAGDYDSGPMVGFYVTISNRQTVNDLIRKLRRARDQAFGADA